MIKKVIYILCNMLKIFAYNILYECRVLLTLSPLHFYETSRNLKGDKIFCPKKISRDKYSEFQILTLLETFFMFVKEKQRTEKIFLSTSEPTNHFVNLKYDNLNVTNNKQNILLSYNQNDDVDDVNEDDEVFNHNHLSNSFPPLTNSKSNPIPIPKSKSIFEDKELKEDLIPYFNSLLFLSESETDTEMKIEDFPTTKTENFPTMKTENFPTMKTENFPTMKISDFQSFEIVNEHDDFSDFSDDEDFNVMFESRDDKIRYLFPNVTEMEKYEKLIFLSNIMPILEYDYKLNNSGSQEQITYSFDLNQETTIPLFDLSLFIRERMYNKLNSMESWFSHLISTRGFLDIKTCEEVVFTLLNENDVLEYETNSHANSLNPNQKHSLMENYDSVYRICGFAINVLKELISKLPMLATNDTKHFLEYVYTVTKIPINHIEHIPFSDDLQERLSLLIDDSIYYYEKSSDNDHEINRIKLKRKQVVSAFIQIFMYIFIEFRRKKYLVKYFSDILVLLNLHVDNQNLNENVLISEEIRKLVKQPLYIYLLL
jgi:hypothetical protein